LGLENNERRRRLRGEMPGETGENMQNTPNTWDALVTTIGKIARIPGRATTSGFANDIANDPISVEAFENEERRLGIRLPPLLKRLYTEVGNGGFGPGYGLLSMTPLSSADHPIFYFYSTFRAARNKYQAEWAEGIVPINDWGDLILSCVDISANCADPPVVRFEPNMPKAATFDYLNGARFRGAGMIPESEKMSTWFEDWINGQEMFNRPYVLRK
jgi:hypothetical protein